MLVRPDEDWRILATMLVTGNWDTAAERSLIAANAGLAAHYVLKKGIELADQGIRVGASQQDEAFDLFDQIALDEVLGSGKPVAGWIQDLIKNRLKDVVIEYLKSAIADPAVLDRAAEWWALRLKSAQ